MKGIKLIILLLTLFLLLSSFSYQVSAVNIIKSSNTSPTYRAVLMGIENYPDPRDNLQTSVDDVYAMQDILKKSDNPYDTTILLNDQVTIKNVRDSLDMLKRNADSDDVSIFYYSGHGGWWEGDSIDPKREGDITDECIFIYDGKIRDDELTDRLAEIPGTVIVILDSCKGSGFVEDLKYIDGSSHKIAMFTAHDENQNLYEIPMMNRALLTFHILAGLATDTNNDNKITVDECYNTAKPIYEDGKDVFGIGYSEGIKLYCSSSAVKDTAIITGFSNDAPETPDISIDTKRGEAEIQTTLNDNDADTLELFVYWGDLSGGWNGPYESGEKIKISHTYSESDTYKISTIVRDKYGAVSSWVTKDVEIKNKCKPISFLGRFNFRFLKLIKPNPPIINIL